MREIAFGFRYQKVRVSQMMQQAGKSFAANQLIRDAADIAARLDELSSKHQPHVVSAAVEQAQREYEALIKRRKSLGLLPENDPFVQTALDGLSARLAFLKNRVGRST